MVTRGQLVRERSPEGVEFYGLPAATADDLPPATAKDLSPATANDLSPATANGLPPATASVVVGRGCTSIAMR